MREGDREGGREVGRECILLMIVSEVVLDCFEVALADYLSILIVMILENCHEE